MKRDEEFKKNEMLTMKSTFWTAAGQTTQFSSSNEEALSQLRLSREQYRAWCEAMNQHNRGHNRWVDDHQEEEEKKEGKADFIDRMFDIMDTQSRALNEKNSETGKDLKDEFGILKEVDQETVQGVSMNDFKKTMMPWIRKFTELKDYYNL